MSLKSLMLAALRRNLEQGGRPRLPAGTLILWEAFIDLSAARTFHANGPNPIAFSEIEAWCRLHQTPLASHHVDVITALDAAYVENYFAKVRDGRDGIKTLPRRSSHPISADLFDAIMGQPS